MHLFARISFLEKFYPEILFSLGVIVEEFEGVVVALHGQAERK
jgi:hypothetical protein